MTPPTALERCPTCDREGCAVAAAAALVASLTIPVTPGENGCACYGEFSRSHNPSRGCEIHGADGSVALEAAWSAERAAREDCHAHLVDWRARALAAEAELAGASAAICDVSDTIRRALDGDERAAFAHQALAVKLRELDAALAERDRAAAAADRILRECRDLARHCAGRDDDVAAAMEGRIRFIKPEVPRG